MILGTILATIGGVVIVGLLQISGTSMEDVRYWQYKYRESRFVSYISKIELVHIFSINFT